MGEETMTPEGAEIMLRVKYQNGPRVSDVVTAAFCEACRMGAETILREQAMKNFLETIKALAVLDPEVTGRSAQEAIEAIIDFLNYWKPEEP
jgi:hypothetical protein